MVDAPAFDLADHVRVVPVPDPGDEPALLRAAEQLRRLRLDRSRPLWQMWPLPGLAEGRVGLFVKIHHVIGDASAGMAALGALLDAAPGAPAGPGRPWTPAPPPAARDLLADNLRHHASGLGHAASALARPVTTARHARAAWTAMREVTTGPPTARTSLDRLVGPGRTMAPIRGSLDQVRQAAHRHHATVNDVLLAVTAAGLRGLLRSRGEPVEGLVVPIYVPIALRPAQLRDQARRRPGSLPRSRCLRRRRPGRTGGTHRIHAGHARSPRAALSIIPAGRARHTPHAAAIQPPHPGA
jgi:diacylglycerol O-acyltransferase